MTSSSRRVASFVHPVQGSAPQDRLPRGPALAITLAGPPAPNPHAPPPSRALATFRRSAMATIGAGLVLMAATAARSATTLILPDAGLLRLCDAFHEAERASHAADDGAWEAHLGRRWQISEAIEDMTPTTDAGRLAKARVALVLMEELADTENAPERFTLRMLRDLTGSVAA